MVSINIPSYKPAEMEIITLASNDILSVSNQTPGTGLEDDPNTDKDW